MRYFEGTAEQAHQLRSPAASGEAGRQSLAILHLPLIWSVYWSIFRPKYLIKG
jgi:hypothetical protein